MLILRSSLRTFRLWRRLLLPWPILLGALTCAVLLGTLGQTALPLISEVGDSRLIYFGIPIFASFCGLASGAPGPFWGSHRSADDRVARLVWGSALMMLGHVVTGALFLIHGVRLSVSAPFFGMAFLFAMLSTVLFGRVFSGFAPFVMTLSSMFSVQTPFSAAAFGWLLDPQAAGWTPIVAIVSSLTGIAIYGWYGSFADPDGVA